MQNVILKYHIIFYDFNIQVLFLLSKYGVQHISKMGFCEIKYYS